jgi:hypothetical protein
MTTTVDGPTADLSGMRRVPVTAPPTPVEARVSRVRTIRHPGRPSEAALVALAHLPLVLLLGPLFDSSGYLAPLAGGVALAGMLGWLAARWLASLSLVCVVGIVAGLAYATVLAVASGGPAGLALRALRDGWPRLLGVALPARPEVLLLVPVGAVLWASVFAAVVLATRTSHPLVPALPAVLGLAATLLLVGHIGTNARITRLLLAGAAVVLVLVAAALRAARPAPGGEPVRAAAAVGGTTVADLGDLPTVDAIDGSAGGRRIGGAASFGLAAVAAVALIGLAAGALVPVASTRFDPRDDYHPPVTNVALPNPLGRVRGQLETTPPRTVFTIRFATVSGRPPTDRIAVAELGDFDGATWSDNDRFVLVDHTLPTARRTPASAVGQVDVRADITLGGLGGDLLPTLGQPRTVSAGNWSGTAYDPVSGALMALATPAAGDRYTLTAQVPAPTTAQLARARPDTSAAGTPYLALPPGVPGAFTGLAQQITGKATTPYGQLRALAAYLADDTRFPYDLGASPGHSYGVLTRFLTGTDTGDQRGYAEQHAAAFAVLARALGFPTRIAVGYLLDRNRSGPGDTFTVTTRQAHAWPQVLFAGIGWMSFEPTDTSQLTKVLPPPSSTQSGGSQSDAGVTPAVVPPIVAPQIASPADQGALGGGFGASPLTGWVLAALVVAVVLVAVPLLVVVAKRLRRTRRRRGDPAARVDGAWRETRDLLADRGVPRARSWTHREVYQAVADRPALATALAALKRLIALADEAMFAVSPGASDAQAREAWRLAGEIRRALARSGGPRRLAAAFDPRTLAPPRGRGSPAPEIPFAARAVLATPLTARDKPPPSAEAGVRHPDRSTVSHAVTQGAAGAAPSPLLASRPPGPALGNDDPTVGPTR